MADTPDPGVVRAWADAYGMPDSYTAVDIESSGLDTDRDYVLQLGWCVAAGRAATENAGVVVNHVAGMADIEVRLFRHQLATTGDRMARRGLQYGWTVDRVSAGLPPREAAGRFVAACDASDHVVSHYGTNFDYPMIDRFCRAHVGAGLPPVESGRLVDTYVLYRAAVAAIRPRPAESYASAAMRVMASRHRAKCGMSACISALGLDLAGAVPGRAHDAVYDSWLAYLLYERLRELAIGGAA